MARVGKRAPSGIKMDSKFLRAYFRNKKTAEEAIWRFVIWLNRNRASGRCYVYVVIIMTLFFCHLKK